MSNTNEEKLDRARETTIEAARKLHSAWEDERPGLRALMVDLGIALAALSDVEGVIERERMTNHG